MYPSEPTDDVIRILGIDPGTDTLGVAIIDVNIDTYEPTVIYGHTFHASKEIDRFSGLAFMRGGRDARLLAHSSNLLEFFQAVVPTVIGAESPFLNRKTVSAFEALVECYAMLRDTVWRYSPSLLLRRIDPVTVKNFVGVDHRGTDKTDVQRAVVARYVEHCAPGVNIHGFDEHTIDAIAVCNVLYRNLLLGEEVVRTKKAKGKKGKVRRRKR